MGYQFWMIAWAIGWALALFASPRIARRRRWSRWPVMVAALALGPIAWHLILVFNNQGDGLFSLEGILHLIYLIPLAFSAILLTASMSFAAALAEAIRRSDGGDAFAGALGMCVLGAFGLWLLAAVVSGAFAFGP